MTAHEFHVSIWIDVPVDMDEAQRSALMAAERARGKKLRESGHIVRIWRRPGRTANIGIWSASSATELNEILASLPLFPWMTIDVLPLATHPLEEDD